MRKVEAEQSKLRWTSKQLKKRFLVVLFTETKYIVLKYARFWRPKNINLSKTCLILGKDLKKEKLKQTKK